MFVELKIYILLFSLRIFKTKYVVVKISLFDLYKQTDNYARTSRTYYVLKLII